MEVIRLSILRKELDKRACMQKLFFLFCGFWMMIGQGNGQVVGKWKITDEHSRVEKSVVEIFEENNMYHGRVVSILPTSKRTHCDACEGDLKGKPLVGMVIIYDLKKNEKGGEEGTILNPANGKTYSCYIELVEPNKLKLRGYLGWPAFGKTMYYNRL